MTTTSDTPVFPFRDQQVVLVGELSALSRREAAATVRQLGGRVVREVSHVTSPIVVGQESWPVDPDGSLDAQLEYAERLRAQGFELEFIDEDEFLRRIGLQETDRPQLYTIAQLTKLFDLPRSLIRAWIRAGLLEPAETKHRLELFEFRQVSRLRLLDDLRNRGIGTSRLRRSLRQLRELIPDEQDPLQLLTDWEERRRLVFRLSDGRLVEANGQMQLDFDAAEAESHDDTAATISIESFLSIDQQLERALDHEDDGNFTEAFAIYDRLLKLHPDSPELHFSLGNTAYATRDLERAAECFRTAVELDPDYVEAWNNLGSLRVESEEFEDAVYAFREAIALRPDYADAHYNLADALEVLDRSDEARRHWMTYLRYDSHSDWATYARERLAEFGMR